MRSLGFQPVTTLKKGQPDQREVKAVQSEAVVTSDVRGNSLEGYTKRSGRNRGRSPRYVDAEQLPGRQYLVSDYAYSKVLSYRQFSPVAYNPGTVSRVTDASLSTALQAGRRLSPDWSRRGTTLQAAAWAQQSACGFWKTTETTGTTSLKWQPAFRLVKVVFVVVN